MAVESDSSNPLCGWKSLNVEDVQGAIPETSGQVGQILIDGLTSNIVIGQDGSVNVQKLFKETGAEEEKYEGEDPVVDGQKEEVSSRDISIDKIMLKNGEVLFTDNQM